MKLQVRGKFIAARQPKKITDTFIVRDFWIDMTDNPKYPNTPQFQLINDNCSMVDSLKKDDIITVSFDIQGRKWEKDGRSGVMTTLKAWAIEKHANEPQPEPAADMEEDDDLPF